MIRLKGISKTYRLGAQTVHALRNVDLTIRTVKQEDFPVGEGIQAGFLSGAQSHTVYGQNEPAMIHFHRALHHVVGQEIAQAAE